MFKLVHRFVHSLYMAANTYTYDPGVDPLSCESDELIKSIKEWRRIQYEYMQSKLDEDPKSVADKMYEKLNDGEIFREMYGASIASDAFLYLSRFLQYFLAQRDKLKELNAKVISYQETIIDLQSQLVTEKGEQMTAVTASVTQTVQDSVKLYSEAVEKGLENRSRDQQASVDIKEVVQTVVREEERSHNLMLFGLQEEVQENTEKLVGELLVELGEKPHIVAERVGRQSAKPVARRTRSTAKDEPSPRPVKVTFSSPALARKILSKARSLRNSTRFGKTFIIPDRSPDQRTKQRELVRELKNRQKEDPDGRHFIRMGEVFSNIDQKSNN